VKTSVTLSKDLLALVDEYVKEDNSRSAFIELAIRTYMGILKRKNRDHHDLEILNRLSEKLNREANDVLRYQGEPLS